MPCRRKTKKKQKRLVEKYLSLSGWRNKKPAAGPFLSLSDMSVANYIFEAHWLKKMGPCNMAFSESSVQRQRVSGLFNKYAKRRSIQRNRLRIVGRKAMVQIVTTMTPEDTRVWWLQCCMTVELTKWFCLLYTSDADCPDILPARICSE